MKYTNPAARAHTLLRAVLPPGTPVEVEPLSDAGDLLHVYIGTTRVRGLWLTSGWPSTLREARTRYPDVTLVMAPHLSDGTRALLDQTHTGWADETGAANILTDQIVVARDGRPPHKTKTSKWTPATMAVAEALLSGVPATVARVHARTQLSVGAVSGALSLLADQGLLDSSAARGPGSARHLRDPRRLLDQYVARTRERKLSLSVGVLWRDPVAGATELGRHWDRRAVAWAASGALAASVMEPLLTHSTGWLIYVEAQSAAELQALAHDAGLEPATSGRLTLTPFPSRATALLSTWEEALRCAPWPRVVADLRRTGVRGEEAADHLADERLRALSRETS